MSQEDRRIRIVPSLKGVRKGVICFETGASRDEVCDLDGYVFEHHGPEHHPLFSPSALRLFHERILLGQAMPQVLLLTRWWRIDQVIAATLFIQPSLALEPACTQVVQSVDLVERLGPATLAHVPWEHRELVRLIRHITQKEEPRQVPSDRALHLVVQAAQHTSQYILEGQLSIEPELPPTLNALATGEGFLAFECAHWAWDVAWSAGAVWGVWFGPTRTEVRAKSALIGLNEKVLEERLGEEFVFEDSASPGWVCPRAMGEEEKQALLERLLNNP